MMPLETEVRDDEPEGSRPLVNVVELTSITKTFGATRALRGVDLTVQSGEVHALLGRNGAGKSTLVSAMSGLVPCDSGTVKVGQVTLEAHGQVYDANLRDQIAHVQQTPQMFDHLTVAENIFIGNPLVESAMGFINQRTVERRAQELIDSWGVDVHPGQLVGSLSTDARQLLEIIKAMSRGVPVVILDEPTAALNRAEKQVLYRNVQTLRDRGIGFVYISHHLEEIFEVADVVTVLRDGQVVTARRPVAELDEAEIARLMIGEHVVRSSRTSLVRDSEPPVLVVDGVQIDRRFDATVDLDLRAGEIVALAGPVGGGKEQLGLIVAGQAEAVRGSVHGPDGRQPVVGFVPTDRHQSGYVGVLSIRENVALGGLDALRTRLGFVDRKRERLVVNRLCTDLDVIASSWEQPVNSLSGGNQQKVVFARGLCRDPRVVVALSPTRGVDVGAKEQLYAVLRSLAAEGVAVLVVSDEHEEIDQLANRAVIIHEGAMVAELTGDYAMHDLVLKMEGVT